MPPSQALRGRVAAVAGATRGAGRGIATALGEQGATVYCTGRSVRGHAASGRPETIEETAERVTAAGGHGIAVRVDHAVPAEVEALFQRVRAEQGRLDVLVNDVWGGEALTEWGTPFWALDLDKGLRLLRNAVETHLITARLGAPLLVERQAGLLVEVTDGDHFGYRGNLIYDLCKFNAIRLAWDFAEELRPQGVAALAVTPGFLRSEAVLDHLGVTEATWRQGAKKDPHFLHSETPLFVGRAVAALAADPKVMAKSGRVWASWTLAKEYGFRDADGSRPDWGAHAREAFAGHQAPAGDAAYASWGDWASFRKVLGM